MEVITISSSEDDPDNPGVEVPVLPAADVSESSGNEGGNDPDKGEPEKGDPQKGDYRVDPEDTPELEDDSEEEDEFTHIWSKLGLQPDKGQIAVIWQDLRQVIIDAFKEQGRMTYTEEEHYLRKELVLVTNMSFIMEQRLELLQLFAMKVEFGPDY